jgi:chromosome segregation ATPase
MARRAVIEQEELFDAANKLAADGKQVTALNLRDALGGGSLTTIYKYLSAWESNRPKNATVTNTAEIPEQVQNAFANTWRIAALEASREVMAVKEKAAEEVKAAQGQFEGALEAIQRLESDTERDTATIEELRARVSELEQSVSSLSQEKAAANAKADQLLHQVKSLETQIDKLHNDHQQDRQAHKEQLEKLSSDYAVAQNKSTEQIERLHKEKDEVQKKAEQVERDRQAAQLKLEAAEKQIQTAEKARDQATAERDQSSRETAQLKGQLEAQKEQIERLTIEVQAKRKTKE